MGAELLQKVYRDTLKFAMKVCLAKVGGEFRSISKCPADDTSKKSKSGELDLIWDGLNYLTIDRLADHRNENCSLLESVYNKEGIVTVSSYKFSSIRDRAKL